MKSDGHWTLKCKPKSVSNNEIGDQVNVWVRIRVRVRAKIVPGIRLVTLIVMLLVSPS